MPLLLGSSNREQALDGVNWTNTRRAIAFSNCPIGNDKNSIAAKLKAVQMSQNEPSHPQDEP
jgi:hypothetical protein